ncbi:hypothetical protein TNCV_1774381 [Trichonephila clavipes]|nr:hypothetical protein TNCV_1774381 [Trichonephila clavipes]
MPSQVWSSSLDRGSRLQGSTSTTNTQFQIATFIKYKSNATEVISPRMCYSASYYVCYYGNSVVDMPLRCLRRQYEQLSEFKSGRIIELMEAGWSARRVARHQSRCNFTVKRCWDQLTEETSFTR